MAEVLMCRPEHFEVSYAINPWMDPEKGASAEKAVAEWEVLRATYEELGHTIRLIDGPKGLPDMVYTANGGFVIDGIAYLPKFTYAERQGETPLFGEWFEANGFEVREAKHINEGEGDIILVGDTILAGHGFRTSLESHQEVEQIFDREVVSLKLVDPRFYHLDTATTVLGDTIAYLPDAFDEPSRKEIERRFPDAIAVTEETAAVLGLNCFAEDGTIVVSSKAGPYLGQLEKAGWNIRNVDLPELLLGGGSIKCCTLRLRR